MNLIRLGRCQIRPTPTMEYNLYGQARISEYPACRCIAISRDISHIFHEKEPINGINIGGTAIGTAINTNPYYMKHMLETLCEVSNMKLAAAVVILFVHVLSMSGLLLGVLPFAPWLNIPAKVFMILFFCHALLSIFIFFFNMEDKEKGTFYLKKNASTVIQRLTALLLIVFIHQHMRAYTTHLPDGQVLMTVKSFGGFVTEFVWMVLLCVHSGISFPKTLLSIGAVHTPKSYQRAQRIVLIATGLMGITATTALIIYFLGG